MTRSAWLLAVLLVLPSCLNQDALDAVDYAFCDPGEACFGGGGIGGALPMPVVCGGKECPHDLCTIGWTCDRDANDPAAQCIGKGDIPGWRDGDKCTEDNCDPQTGKVTHRKYTAKDIDDGDPCTIDNCQSVYGITHGYACSDVCNDPAHCP